MLPIAMFDDEAIENTIAALAVCEDKVPVEVLHIYSEGLYIREMRAKAGTFLISRLHKEKTLNVMLSGKVQVVRDGAPVTMTAPTIFESNENERKVGVIIEDVSWWNVYPTTEQLLYKLEETYYDAVSLAPEKEAWFVDEAKHDFLASLDALGITEEQVYAESRVSTDIIPLPFGVYKAGVYKSNIEGFGVFATANISEGEAIGLGRIGGKRTQFGRYTNHSHEPNAKMVLLDSGDVVLIALTNIYCGSGVGLGDEITIDYHDAYLSARGE